MTAIDKAWNVAKQEYNFEPERNLVQRIYESYLHAIQLSMDSFDDFVKQDIQDNMAELLFEDPDNFASTMPTGVDETHIQAMMQEAKSQVLRKLRGA